MDWTGSNRSGYADYFNDMKDGFRSQRLIWLQYFNRWVANKKENNADVGICFLIEKRYVGGVTSADSSSAYSLLPSLLSIPGDAQGAAGWGSEHLMELQVALFIAGQLDQMAFKGPFPLKQFYDSTYQLLQLQHVGISYVTWVKSSFIFWVHLWMMYCF